MATALPISSKLAAKTNQMKAWGQVLFRETVTSRICYCCEIKKKKKTGNKKKKRKATQCLIWQRHNSFPCVCSFSPQRERIYYWLFGFDLNVLYSNGANIANGFSVRSAGQCLGKIITHFHKFRTAFPVKKHGGIQFWCVGKEELTSKNKDIFKRPQTFERWYSPNIWIFSKFHSLFRLFVWKCCVQQDYFFFHVWKQKVQRWVTNTVDKKELITSKTCSDICLDKQNWRR